MKKLFSVNLLVLTLFAISFADDCGVQTMSQAIQLYRDFDALHMRACHDLVISSETYQLMRKKCVKDLVSNFDYESYGDVFSDFWESDCFRNYGLNVCDDDEYHNFKHCAFDFGLGHLEQLLELYKNRELMDKSFNYADQAKECLTRGVKEIEANHHLEEIHV